MGTPVSRKPVAEARASAGSFSRAEPTRKVTTQQMTLTIRPAQITEADLLTRIAQEAKRYWGYPEHWLKVWQDALTIRPEFIDQHPVFVAENEGNVVGFYALVLGNDKGELEHLWVAPTHIGTGVGKELFLHAMQTAAKRSLGEVEIVSDPNAEGFYQKMGAHRIDEDISEIDGQKRTLPRLTIDPKS